MPQVPHNLEFRKLYVEDQLPANEFMQRNRTISLVEYPLLSVSPNLPNGERIKSWQKEA